MVDDTLSVHGGVGGLTAEYDDMLTYATGLEAIVAALTERAQTIGSVISDGDLLASSVLSPGTAARVAEHVTTATVGPRGLVPTAAGLGATALWTRASVEAYRAVDAARAKALWVGQALAAPMAVVDVIDKGIDTAELQLLADLATGHLPGSDLLTAFQDGALHEVWQHPWMVDAVIHDAPALLWVAGALTPPWLSVPVGLWAATSENSVFPPFSLEQASADLIGIGRLFGQFGVGTPGFEKVDLPLDQAASASLPSSVSDVMRGVTEAYGRPGDVRIFSIVQPDGSKRWVVEIPGTEEWSPTAGSNPLDLTNNLRLMAGQDTVQNEAIRRAMHDAGIQPGDPVLLAGHSQGGITAASLASDPATRAQFHITNVVTAGAPIARFDIPKDVTVLSLEHTQDAVPRLDGNPNPDAPNWVTVRRDPTGLPTEPGSPNVVDSVAEVHGSSIYVNTAGLVDTSTDPSLVAVKQSLQPFLDATTQNTTMTEYHVTRNVP